MKERVLCRLYKNEDGGDTMDKDNVSIFKLACERYLNTLGLGNLRSYGRFLQLKEPTKRNKAELIQEIIGVLCGEIIAKRTKRGAPIKNTYVEPQILQTVQALQKKYGLDVEKNEEENVKRSDNDEKGDCEVILHLEIKPSALTVAQKQLLNEFLNSL